MDEVQKILAANLMESLHQVQDYLVLALGASFSAAALSFLPAASPSGDSVPVPGISIPLPRWAAHLLLWVLCLVGGFMAGNSAQLGYLNAVKLTSVPGFLAAIQMFPSVATSPLLLVRTGMMVVPPVLSGLAVCWQLRREKAPGIAMAVMLFFLLAAYVPLWLQMSQLSRVIGTLK